MMSARVAGFSLDFQELAIVVAQLGLIDRELGNLFATPGRATAQTMARIRSSTCSWV